MVKLHGK